MAASAALALPHQVGWQGEGIQGLGQGLCHPLRLAPIPLKAFRSVQATTLSGFGLLFSVSLAGGHGTLLLTVMLARHGEKAPMSSTALDCKNFLGPHTVALRRWLLCQRYGKVRRQFFHRKERA